MSSTYQIPEQLEASQMDLYVSVALRESIEQSHTMGGAGRSIATLAHAVRQADLMAAFKKVVAEKYNAATKYDAGRSSPDIERDNDTRYHLLTGLFNAKVGLEGVLTPENVSRDVERHGARFWIIGLTRAPDLMTRLGIGERISNLATTIISDLARDAQNGITYGTQDLVDLHSMLPAPMRTPEQNNRLRIDYLEGIDKGVDQHIGRFGLAGQAHIRAIHKAVENQDHNQVSASVIAARLKDALDYYARQSAPGNDTLSCG